MNRGGFGGYGRRGTRRSGGQSYYMMITLLVQVVRRLNQLPHKPPVTVFLLALNCCAYYAPELLGFFFLPRVSDACLRPEQIYRGQSVLAIFNPTRLLFHSVLHAHEYHLYHNMLSLLGKGIQLELKHSSGIFAFMTAFLLLGSSTLYVSLSHLASVSFGSPPSCAIGFSAVLFGYKVISMMESSDSGRENVFFGFHVPRGVYVSWMELITIQYVHPEASFLGHLCGIVSGYAYYGLFLRPPGGGGRQNQRDRNVWSRFKSFLFGGGPRRFHGHGTASDVPRQGQSSAQDSSSSSYMNVREKRLKKFK